MLWLLSITLNAQISKYTLSGQVTEASSGEDVISATIYIPELAIGTISNEYGFYSITLPEKSYDVIVSYVGMADQKFQINLDKNRVKHIEMADNTAMLEDVVVVAEKENKNSNVDDVGMSKENVKVGDVEELPALFGEVDVIKYIQLLPGVKSIGEGGSGFYVRGGNADQNLVLLDEAPIYNASHLLGFFSAFNPDAVKDMQLYKGAIPAHYGGRLSSVLDIRMKEGNSKRFALNGGIGSIMSRLAVEAPLTKNGSFMIAGRRSYLDVMAGVYLRTFKKRKLEDKFYFYDLNTKANYRINNNNRIFASGYFGKDVAKSEQEGLDVNWGNKTATLRWNHIFSNKLFSNFTYYYSEYQYGLAETDEEINVTLNWDSRLKEHSGKIDFGAYLNPNNMLKFGVHFIQHDLSPGDLKLTENDSVIQEFNFPTKKAYESALYISNSQVINSRLKVDYGLRVSALQNYGPEETYTYDELFELQDTVNFNNGIYNTYWNLEPRVGARYKINPTASIKASYNRTAQYIQQASNGNMATPLDIWFMSSEVVKPQIADQFAIGFFKNFNEDAYEFSLELYYKLFQNAIEFKDHADLMLNPQLEGELRIGEGRAYGLEFMVKKNRGKLTGWIGYTLSKAEKKIETINDFNWFNAKHDKPHDLTVVANYKFGKRLSAGGSFVYSSGSAVTFPTGRYFFRGISVPVYAERNGARLPDFHRMDLSLNFVPKKNATRRLQNEWVLSIYNVYNRKNAFAINFKTDFENGNQSYAEKSAIFSIVPSITYNAKF